MTEQCCVGGPAARRLARRLSKSAQDGHAQTRRQETLRVPVLFGGTASVPFALSRAAASIMTGTALVLLPKCPLCLAAWLTVLTGVGFSAADAALVREILVVFWVAVMAVTAAAFFRRRAVALAPSFLSRLVIRLTSIARNQRSRDGVSVGRHSYVRLHAPLRD